MLWKGSVVPPLRARRALARHLYCQLQLFFEVRASGSAGIIYLHVSVRARYSYAGIFVQREAIDRSGLGLISAPWYLVLYL